DFPGEKLTSSLAGVGRERGAQGERLVRPAMRDARAGVMTGERAIGKAETRNRAAETIGVGALEIEARLHRQPAQRGADRFAFDLDGAGRQGGVPQLALALDLDGADHRAVGVDAAGAARALETGVAEGLADDERSEERRVGKE